MLLDFWGALRGGHVDEYPLTCHLCFFLLSAVNKFFVRNFRLHHVIEHVAFMLNCRTRECKPLLSPAPYELFFRSEVLDLRGPLGLRYILHHGV